MRLVAVCLAVLPHVLLAQSSGSSAQLIARARSYVAAHQLDSAQAALDQALATAPYAMDSVNAHVWLGIVHRLRGNDSLARASFRSALSLNFATSVRGLDQFSPGLSDLFDSEARAFVPRPASALDRQPTWSSGPALVYPPALRRRGVSGPALVRAVVDTLGRIQAQSIEVLDAPDSAFHEPLKAMMRATTFKPGMIQGRPVLTYATLSLSITPPRRPPTMQLITRAREQARSQPDTALALLAEALDSAAGATPGERVYALLVQGIALHRKGADSLSRLSLEAGIAGYRDLTARGVDLAPFLRRLADSVRLSRRGPARAAASPFGRPTALETVDQQPALLSHPPIRYPPEMQALRIGGTVVVEALLDTTGRVVPATVKVAQSPNPAFNAEARRIVIASTYRAARMLGRSTRVTIHQAITFAPY